MPTPPPSPRLIAGLGAAAVALVVFRAWREGTDPLAASLAVVLVAVVVVGHALWARPRRGVSLALIGVALALGLWL